MEWAIVILCFVIVLIQVFGLVLVGGRVWRYEQADGEYRVYFFRDRKTPVPIAAWLFKTLTWSKWAGNFIVLILAAALLLNFFLGDA